MLRPASFKGVPFRVEDDAAEVGRRTVLHEYPYRDVPSGEDLGRAARRFNVSAFFFGVDGPDELQELIEALESGGPGTLRHPWLGNHLCQLDGGSAKIRFPRAEAGKIVVDLVFVEAGQNLEPDAQDDTDAQLEAAADEAQAASDDLFSLNWLDEIAGLAEAAAAMVEQMLSGLDGMLAPLDQALSAIDRVINAVQRIINAPLALIGKIQGRLQALVGRLTNPFSGLSAWRQLLRGDVLHPYQTLRPNASYLNGSKPAWAQAALSAVAPPKAGQLPAMPPAMADYVRRTLVIEAARSIPRAAFVSKADVETARGQILQALDTELKAAPDVLYPAFSALRVAVAQSLQARTPTLADIETLQSAATRPALVLAYQVNGDVEAEADLVARNQVRHPGFVPAGQVEVLKRG
ncbi:DNA circularization protein [Chromobacterium haemolyticum]|uniref:DNA circulation N-terminal domain-containing protein n=1 Tax=Chromobacterium haemolyticum TaxID=394935 RepID=A0A1W0CCN0_9NEIS|nr:DNA circularization N-terminal domain-containing protein [Chromobacterium haemolyticum]OQS32461.1 hypothetical protein B0T45_21640 [Chromobacterium haemolyticum]